MSLLGSIIVSVCVGTTPGSYQAACNAVLDAGTKQTGVDKDMDTIERNGSKIATEFYEKELPDDIKPALGTFVFIAKTTIDRRVSVPLPNLGLCNKVATELTPSSATISMKWSF